MSNPKQKTFRFAVSVTVKGSIGESEIRGYIQGAVYDMTDEFGHSLCSPGIENVKVRRLNSPTAEAARRHKEAVAKAAAKGHYAKKGRPRKVDGAAVRTLGAKGLTPEAIMKKLSISKATYYRIQRELNA